MWCTSAESERQHSPCSPCTPSPLRPLKRRGRLINRPLQPMKTGGNNPDKRQIWRLSYKTNFNCTPFFKSSSGWRTRELNPCGCRICFSLIALSGYLIRWQMTKTPPFADKLSLSLSDTQTVSHNAFSVFLTHMRTCMSSHTLTLYTHTDGQRHKCELNPLASHTHSLQW